MEDVRGRDRSCRRLLKMSSLYKCLACTACANSKQSYVIPARRRRRRPGSGGVRPARQRRSTSSPPALGERKESEAAIEALSLSPLYNVESVSAMVGRAAAAAASAASAALALHSWSFGWFGRPGLLLESALLHSSGT